MPTSPAKPPSAFGLTTSDGVIASWLALLLFGIYLLSFSGRITSSDGLSMLAVTESLVKRGEFSTDQMWTLFSIKSIPAPDGQVYSKYSYGTSLFAAPFYALALYIPFSGLMQVALLANAVAAALTGALLYLSARRLSFSPTVALIVTLLFGLATPAWVYAKEFWSESFALLTLLGSFYFLLVYRRSGHARDAFFAGTLLGLAIAVRTTNILLAPLYAWYGFVAFNLPLSWTGKPYLPNGETEREKRTLAIQWRALVLFLIPIFVFLISIFAYNAVRFGSPLTTGYRPDEDFSNNVLLGIYGLLFSPGKGLFVYAPFLVVLPYGVWQFYKRARRELLFILLLAACYLLLFSAWYYWWGGTNWAARFLVPTLPFLVLLCAPFVELILEPRRGWAFRLLQFTFAILVMISFLNALAGVAVNSLSYRLRALNLSGNPDWDTIFQPYLSPLLGHWQILKPTNLDVAWLRATPEDVQIDWLVVILTLAFIAFCAWTLIRLLRGQRARRGLLAAGVFAAVALSFFSLARYADDPRLGGSAGYEQLLGTLARSADASVPLILNDDAQARYFFNANRTRLKWYGLSRDPARWDAATQALVARLAQQNSTVWFAYDESVDAPNPMREWMQEHWQQLAQFNFEDGVHLVEYSTRAAR